MMRCFSKVLITLFTGMMLCCFFSSFACAAVCGDYTYQLTNVGSEGVSTTMCRITGYNGPGGDIEIPTSLDGYPVYSIGNGNYKDNITSIVVPMGRFNFDECFNDLQELKSITFLGKANVWYSFSNCPKLKDVTVYGEAIVSESFSNNPNLETVVFNGKANISDWCFNNCESLSQLTFLDDVNTYESFNNCPAIEQLTFLGDAGLGESSFDSCTNLSTVSFGEDTKFYIGDGSFSNCLALKRLYYGNNCFCTGIGQNAFSRCTGLEELLIPVNDCSVYKYCFDQCNNLKRIVFSGQGASINDNAFSDCKGLTDFVFCDGVVTIGENAFNGCMELKNITFGDGLTSISDYAFRGCSSLSALMLPPTVESVSENAFFGCNAVRYAAIGSTTAVSLSRAGYTFTDPDYPGISLMHTFHQNEVSGFEVVSADTGMASAVIPQSVTAVGKAAFSGCTLLNHVSFPDSVNEIGQSAFYDCRRLKEVYIPETVTSIGDSAFNPNTTIYCYEYTVAEAWANRNGFKVVLLDQKPFEEIGRITLPEELYVQNGTQKTVTAEIFPNTPDLVPVWTSSDPTVATVSEDGVLTALQNGETTLTLTVKGKTAQCTVHVVTMAEDFTIPAELYVQAKKSIAAPVPAVTPEDATVHLEWSADNALAVEISPAGSITGYVVGDTVLTAKDTISGLTKTATLHIVRPVSAISVTPAAAGLIPYEPLQLTAQARIGTTEIGEVGATWTSEDPSVAVVDESGRVQALSPGRTRIVATFDGRATAACTLTVREAATIRLPASLKTVSANALTGTTAELYILPDSVERIESGAFANLQYARVIVIPEGAAAGTEADAFAGTDAVLVHPDGTPFEP